MSLTADIEERGAFALRNVYGPKGCPAKRVARDFHLSEKQARRWLNRLPMSAVPHVLKRFGPRVAAFVLEPCGPWANAWRVAAELDDLKASIERLEQVSKDEWKGSGGF